MDRPSTKLAPITPDDVDPYRTARLRALREDPEGFSELFEDMAAKPDDFWTDRVRENSQHDTSSTHLAWLGEHVVGMATGLRFDQAAAAELVGMWVAPDARGRGLGAQLVSVIVDWARVNRADSIELWVMTTNERARRLYERCGFEVKDGHCAAPDDPCRNEVRMRMDIER